MTTVAIAGCGLIAGAPLKEGRPIATNHAAAIAAAGCTLVGAADPDLERREVFARHWHLRQTFPSAEAMLQAVRPDILVVATPPSNHAELCRLAVASGVRGILCEKPFTGHAREAAELVAACRAKGVPLAVNFTRRWDATHASLLRAIDDGTIGEVRSVVGSYTGTLRGNGSHLVDTVRMLTRMEWTIAWTSTLPSGDDGPVAATLTSGRAVLHMAPIIDADYFVFEIHLLGTRGRARLLLGGNDVRIDCPAVSAAYPGYRYLLEERSLPKDTLPQAFARAHTALAAAVRGEAPLPYDAQEHVETLGLLDRLIAHATSKGSQP